MLQSMKKRRYISAVKLHNEWGEVRAGTLRKDDGKQMNYATDERELKTASLKKPDDLTFFTQEWNRAGKKAAQNITHWQLGSVNVLWINHSEWSEMKSLSRVQLFVTPWIAAYHAPPSVGFSRQEYWSGLPFPSPGDFPNTGIKPGSPTLQADTLPGKLRFQPQISR